MLTEGIVLALIRGCVRRSNLKTLSPKVFQLGLIQNMNREVIQHIIVVFSNRDDGAWSFT
jgi:hypothetical protein